LDWEDFEIKCHTEFNVTILLSSALHVHISQGAGPLAVFQPLQQ